MMLYPILTLAQDAEAATPETPGMFDGIGYGWRILIILAIAVGAHLLVRLIRILLHTFVKSRYGGRGRTKALTLAHFSTSALVFIIYFIACGMIFAALDISLTAYLASATIIGFAVSFGSQGLIQDVITGLTLITSDLVDVGDMVEIGGQAGIVRRVGMRYTVIMNYTGAEVFIPNRNISNAINYRSGYIRVFLDAWLPDDEQVSTQAIERIKAVTQTISDQFSGLMLGEHEVIGAQKTEAGTSYVRIKFRIWPGQNSLIESVVKQAVLTELKSLKPDYADWMVTVQYRVDTLAGK